MRQHNNLRQQVLFGVVVVLSVLALAMVLKPDLLRRGGAANVASDPPAAPAAPAYDDRVNHPTRTFAIVVDEHKLVSGPSDIIVQKGESVRVDMTVGGEEEEKVKLDGFDVSTEASPTAPGGMSFIADKTGTFKFYALSEEAEEAGDGPHDEKFLLGQVIVR